MDYIILTQIAIYSMR